MSLAAAMALLAAPHAFIGSSPKQGLPTGFGSYPRTSAAAGNLRRGATEAQGSRPAAMGFNQAACMLSAVGIAALLLRSSSRAARRSGKRSPSGPTPASLSRQASSVVPLRAQAGIRIVGTGSCAPETVVTNDDLSEILDTSDEWIQQRTGIRCRHILKPDESLTKISIEAGRRALEQASIDPADVDLVILGTSSPDDVFGSAPAVAAGVGATNAVAFDLTAACSGFVFSLVTASQYIRSGGARTVLVLGADCLSRWVDWTDRGTCVLFGDGAGAVVLQATEAEHDRLVGYELGSDGGGAHHLNCAATNQVVPLGGGKQGGNTQFQPLAMNGNEVFRFATSTVPRVLTSLLKNNGVQAQDIDWLLLHQANRRIMDLAAKRLGLPMEKVLCNLDEYGNTSAASIPLALDEAVRDGRVKSGQLIACVGFGAGLSWGGMLIRM